MATKQKTKKVSVLTVTGSLRYFDTVKEAEEYTKNFPVGTYKISGGEE